MDLSLVFLEYNVLTTENNGYKNLTAKPDRP